MIFESFPALIFPGSQGERVSSTKDLKLVPKNKKGPWGGRLPCAPRETARCQGGATGGGDDAALQSKD